MSTDENYWKSDEAQKYHADVNYKTLIYRKFANFVDSCKPNTLLDYGCGNGYIDTLLDRGIEKTLYDMKASNVTIDDLEKYNCKIESNAANLPKDYFDVVLLNFVLICIPNEKIYSEILSAIKQVKKKNGRLIILECHPCFMQYDNSYFSSEFSEEFQYLSCGKLFTKNINAINRETGEKEKQSFTDYHWPLSFTINKLIECGFNIVHMGEYPDLGFEKYIEAKNEFYPPIYSLVCK